VEALLTNSSGWLRERVAFILSYLRLRRTLKSEIRQLGPWYQPISLGCGLNAAARDKTGHRYRFWSLDRGVRKWETFVRPNLPFELADKRVLELGCNAGLFLVECVKQGAREAVGIEKDDHYYRQARFVAGSLMRLYGRYYPIRVYQGSIEEFAYEALGKFDLALLLNVVYHIGKTAGRNSLTGDEIATIQVETLRRLARVAEYLLFQANPLKDEGRGKGKGSLLNLVDHAGLKVVKEVTYNHPRGYILLTKSEAYHKTEAFPLTRMMSKYFLPAGKSAERELVDLYVKCGRNGFDITQTRYYRLRTGQLDWLTPGVAHLPVFLDRSPAYWVMPWSYKYRERGSENNKKRVKTFPMVYERFVALIDSILERGFDPSKSIIPGYQLIHPEWGEVFIYTDGNQRMGVLSYLAAGSDDGNLMIPVQIRQVLEREKMLDYPLTKQLMEEGHFTEKDVFRWFDNAFWFLKE
jgi:SAM-dependent methyltransferase